MMSRLMPAALSITLAAGVAHADPRVREYVPVDHSRIADFDDDLDLANPFVFDVDGLLRFDDLDARPTPAPVPRIGARDRVRPGGEQTFAHRPTPMPAPARNGWVVTHHPNGQKAFEGFFQNGSPVGWVTRWYPNGQKSFEAPFTNGVANGWVTTWYENGQKRSQDLLTNGLRNGISTTWYRNGQKRTEGIYWMGTPQGWFQSWHQNGRKATEQFFRG